MTNRVYITNNGVDSRKITDIVFAEEKGIEQLFAIVDEEGKTIERTIDTTGNTLYIIDVHCKFKEAEKMQQQGGVIIYRHLLKQFEKCQDKLKVIFYSPISKENLAALKPENYVLTLLPFVELFPKGKDGNDILNWNFNDALEAAEKKNCPQFNNASENLLSGWALAGANKINLNGKKPLVIDDEWQQWEATYKTVLSETPDYFLSNMPNLKTEYKKLNEGAFNHLQKDSLASYDLIISDLYLHENHDTDKWKTEDIIDDISGFKLFQKIRKIEPAIPVVFHTTSTKFRIYETLTALGADGQIPKNINPEAVKNERTDTAKLLTEKLERITAEYSDCWLNEFYRFVKKEDFKEDKKLQALKNDSEKLNEFKNILLHAIISCRNLLDNKIRTEYYDAISFNPVCLSISGIISQLGKIPEKFKFLENYAAFNFISNLRDHTSHTSHYTLFEKEDLNLVFAPIYISLKSGLVQSEKFSAPHNTLMKDKKMAKHFYKHPVLNYLFFYYGNRNLIPSNLEAYYQSKISGLLKMYFTKNWFGYNDQHKNTVKNHFKFLNKRDPNLTEAKINFGNGNVSVTLN